MNNAISGNPKLLWRKDEQPFRTARNGPKSLYTATEFSELDRVAQTVNTCTMGLYLR